MIMELIGIDEERVKKDGYVVKSMWDIIDEAYSYGKCEKEPQPDGTVLYKGNISSKNLFADFYYAFCVLSENPWFAKYCTKWIKYTNEADETQPFAYEDCLAIVRKELPLFKNNK